MKMIGLQLDGLSFRKALIDDESITECSTSCGLISGPLQEGLLAQINEDSFSSLKSEIIPGGSPALLLKNERSLSQFMLPPWAIWTRIRSGLPEKRTWSCYDSQCRSVSLDLEEQVGRLIKNEASGINAKGAFVIDDDLELSVQDRLIRYIGEDVELLPKSVATILAYSKGKEKKVLKRLDSKSVLVVNLGIGRATVTKTRTKWLDKKWKPTGSEKDGFLVPEIEQLEHRVLSPLNYIPMDICKICSTSEHYEEHEFRLLNLWADLVGKQTGSEVIHYSSLGWHEEMLFNKTSLNKKEVDDLLSVLGIEKADEKADEPFSRKTFSEFLKNILSEEAIDLILISDETSGLLDINCIDRLDLETEVDYLTGDLAIGCSDFLIKKQQGFPTYLERLPDIFLRGKLAGSTPQWFPLVSSVDNFAKGGETYEESMGFNAMIKAFKESILVNLKMGQEDAEENYKYSELLFNVPFEEEIVFEIKVRVKASQGYGVVSLQSLNSNEFRKKNGDIILDWQKLEGGFLEAETGLQAPPSDDIQCMDFDPENSCYDSILNAFAQLTVKVSKASKAELDHLLKDPTEGIHPNMRNGLTFGSDPRKGIDVLIGSGWDETSEDVWDEFLEFNETLKILWNDLSRFSIAQIPLLKDWISRAGSHMWADTQPFIVEFLAKKITRSSSVQFIEAAGRCFHDKITIGVFIEEFKKMGHRRIAEVKDPYSDRETLSMQHWFKAFSFIFRTNEYIHEWVQAFQIQAISKIFRYQIEREWLKFERDHNRQILSSPLRQTFLASLYILRLREQNAELFELKDLNHIQSEDQKLALKLYETLFRSWIKIPWIPPGDGRPTTYLNTISVHPNESFLFLFLWPEKQEVYSVEDINDRYNIGVDLGICNRNYSLDEILNSYLKKRWIVDESGSLKIDKIPSNWIQKFVYDDNARKPIQVSIARFLQKKADNSDLIITDAFTEVFS
jgi:hypothetical protein